MVNIQGKQELCKYTEKKKIDCQLNCQRGNPGLVMPINADNNINRQRGSEKESDNQNGETEGKQTGEKPAREK